MKYLTDYIGEKLTEYHSRVYLDSAPAIDPSTQKPPLYPYVVYSIPANSADSFRDDVTLEIDIWSDNIDTTDIEVLANNIYRKLHRFHHIDKNFQAVFYRLSNIPVPDPEEYIRRRRVSFLIRHYERSQ